LRDGFLVRNKVEHCPYRTRAKRDSDKTLRIVRGLDVDYLLAGKDIVINDLKKVKVEQDGPHVIVSGEQE